jgi:hypothetical protein
MACTSSNTSDQNNGPLKKESKPLQQQNEKSENGEPTKEEARLILKEWFDRFKNLVGGYTYEPESYEVLYVTGDAEKAQIQFKWTGTVYPPSTPNSAQTPSTYTDQKKSLLISKSGGTWIVDEVRDLP